jgi:hypothetical protein
LQNFVSDLMILINGDIILIILINGDNIIAIAMISLQIDDNKYEV